KMPEKLLLTHEFTAIRPHRQTYRQTPRNFLRLYKHFPVFQFRHFYLAKVKFTPCFSFMRVLWNYLQPHRGLVFLSLLLAGISQVLALYDPVIFGKIIDQYATPPFTLSSEERVSGAIKLMLLAVAIALVSRLAKAFQEYFTNLVVQKFGVQIFNDGLKQTLRLSYQEYADQNSGETLSILQRVRRDTERFITAF